MRILSPRSAMYVALYASVVAVGVLLSWLGDSWLRAIGASLAAAGIGGGVIYYFAARFERIESEREALDQFGLKKIFDGRSVLIREEYDSRCERMQKNLDIMGFGLSNFVEDHRDDLPRWKMMADIRILVIDPDYPSQDHAYADQRDSEERSDRGRIRRDVENLRSALEPLIGEQGGRSFQVRLYTCLPSINIFRIDNELLWGPYFMARPSRNTPTFLVGSGGILFERIMDHFDAIWNDPDRSRPLPADLG